MYISSIIKSRTTSEKNAAIALEKAVKGVGRSSQETLQDVKLGVERASWYSSCLFDKYDNVCSELKNEDSRFIKSVFEIYKRKDVIADIMQMYVSEELKKTSNSKIQSLDIKLAKVIAGYSGGRLTKTAMANSLSILIVNSFGFKNEVLFQLNKYSLAIVTATYFYGKVQMAAQWAKKLRSLSPELYYMLYQNNMEMLYFLVGEKIEKTLINSMDLRGEDRFVSIIKHLTN
ncbi:hypothetical protein [Serratia plymuthica]|uniref:hypothetical protein n=1 Tax=Serratia plymuthica TaxID=82996 RepID=UPI0018D9CA79|nr:hypothetical protein [Serratia plymuthica]QPS54710.1 hypothetical protein I6G53_18815 [Serratia plymuthica]CAI1627682.1 Uncharacterised protein [Serratia plymuthica]